MIGEIGFVILGLAILVSQMSLPASHLVEISAAGVLIGSLAAGAFFIVQRRAFSFLERIFERFVPSAAVHAAALHQAIANIHSRLGAMAGGFVLHLAGWLSAAFGTWLALYVLKAPLGFIDAIAIESILCGTRSAVVFVPGAVGVQEAGYAMMMPLFGLSPGLGVALSLVRRAQQFATGIPTLISWQVAEGGRAVETKSSV